MQACKRKKKRAEAIYQRVTHSLPINTPFRPCLCIPLPLWLVQQLASQAHPKAWLCMAHFFRYSRGFCFAFNLQRLPAYLIREVTLTCHVLTLCCKSYFSHCQHLHLLAWKEGLWWKNAPQTPFSLHTHKKPNGKYKEVAQFKIHVCKTMDTLRATCLFMQP